MGGLVWHLLDVPGLLTSHGRPYPFWGVYWRMWRKWEEGREVKCCWYIKRIKKNLKREGREKQWTILQTCQFSCISKNSMEMVCAPSELFLTGLVLSMSIILCRCQLHILYIHCWLKATLLFLEPHLSRLLDSLFCLHHEVSSRCTILNWF